MIAVLSVLVLYFGFDTKSSKEKGDLAQIEKSGISLDIIPLIESAKQALNSADLNEINALEHRVQTLQGEEEIAGLKELSGKWYRLNAPHIAGHYAEAVAEKTNSAEAWSIAATTYLAGVGQQDRTVSDWCLNQAIQSFENAISIDPGNTQYRVNLALLYAEKPPQDNPMKGVQMLLALNEKYPDDVLVLNALARLAVKTGQWDRAKARLEKSASLQEDNASTICLLADVYQQLDDVRAQAMKDKCEFLTSKR
ncbi:MAG: hypothetical protein KDC53_11620 [Saprospiraceae bacterium]|nr:hypothetical protein [Saprospiraceae bacterium]